MLMKKRRKTVALISFYDRVWLSNRFLSSILRKNGHHPHLIFFLGRTG
jgi:hypothetical protein